MRWRAIPILFRLSWLGCTDNVVNAVSAAWTLAADRGQNSVTPEHVLIGLMTLGGRSVFGRLGRTFEFKAVAGLVGPRDPDQPKRHPALGQETIALLRSARTLARELGQPFVATDHVLLALIHGPSRPASEFLTDQGIEAEAILGTRWGPISRE